MKKVKRKFLLMIGVFLLLTVAGIANGRNSEAYAAVSGDFRYFVNDGGESVTVMGYNGSDTTVVVPDTIEGYPVTILDGTFWGNKTVETVVIPKYVVRIKGYCFEECGNLQKVVMNDLTARIGPKTFYNCVKLKEINLPDTCFLIEESAFYNCKSLVEIKIPKKVYEIGEATFDGCTALKTVSLPDRLEKIGKNAFMMCTALENINIPVNVTKIEEGAFRACNAIKELYIPDNLKILERPDMLPKNTQYYVKEGSTAYEILSAADDITPVSKTDISKLVFNYAANQIYSGSDIRPSVTVRYGKEILKENIDYKVGYENNTDIGISRINISAIGKYTGNKALSVKINPEKVEGVKQTGSTSNSVKLQWNRVTGTVDGYIVYRYDPVSKKTTRLYSKTNGISDSNLEPSGKYTYKVCAYKIADGNTLTGTVSEATAGITCPDTVSGFRWKESKSNRISLRWNKPSNKVSGYQIYKYNPNKGKFILLKTISQASQISWTNMYLKSNTQCRYKIRAYLTVNNKTYYSPFSQEIQATTATAAPKYKLVSDKKGEIKITWDKVAGATGYALFYKTGPDGEWKQLTNSQYTGNSYTKKNLQSGKKYYFYLKAVKNYNGVKVKSSTYFKNKTAK